MSLPKASFLCKGACLDRADEAAFVIAPEQGDLGVEAVPIERHALDRVTRAPDAAHGRDRGTEGSVPMRGRDSWLSHSELNACMRNETYTNKLASSSTRI